MDVAAGNQEDRHRTTQYVWGQRILLTRCLEEKSCPRTSRGSTTPHELPDALGRGGGVMVVKAHDGTVLAEYGRFDAARDKQR